jgi:hypothetical protein
MTTKRQLFVCVIVGFLSLVFVAGSPSASQGDEHSHDLVGTWFVYVCPDSSDPCSTASLIINLTSFTKDGVTIGADFGNPAPSPGLGVWVRTGPNQFATTFVELLSDTSGALSGRVKLRGALIYDPKSDTLSGPFKGDVTDASGQNVVDHFEGTALLTRMQVEPLH